MANDWKKRPYHVLAIVSVVSVAVACAYLITCYVVLFLALAPPPKIAEVTPVLKKFAVEAVHFRSETDDVALSGWLLRSAGNRAIVLVHGVESHVWSDCQPVLARSLLASGFNVLVFDLRAHGRSGGNHLGLGWDEKGDVVAAVNLLIKRGFAPSRIGVHGLSYGAATALLAAPLLPKIGAIVADSAFADIREIMAVEIAKRTGVPAPITDELLRPGISLVAKALYGLDLEAITPERAVPAVAAPILFIQGEKDPVVPVEHTRRLRAVAHNARDDIWILTDKGHTEGVCMSGRQELASTTRRAYLTRVTEFFSRHLN